MEPSLTVRKDGKVFEQIAPSRAVTSFLLRFLSPTRGTEGVVKTIEKAWLEVELPLERETEGFEKILL